MENDKKLELELDTIEDNQEETTTEETTEDVVTIPKKEFTVYRRKAMAYDATKRSPITKTKTEPDNELVKTVERLELSDRKRQFGFENGLSPEETDYVFTFSANKPSKDTLEHPFVKAGIESLRKSKTVEMNTPSGSRSHSPLFGGKSYTELSEDEKRQQFEERMKGLVK